MDYVSVPHLISDAKERIAHKMPKVEHLSGGDMMTIVAIYTCAFAINFTDWIGKTMRRTISAVGLKALGENLDCEMEDDHVSMLLDFSEQCHATPGPGDYKYISTIMADIRSLFKDRVSAGLAGMTVLTLLENTSEIFIPILAEIGEKLRIKDFKYTDVHGLADVKHSRALALALEEEFRHYEVSREPNWPTGKEIVERAASLTIELVCHIFLARTINR